MGAKELLVLEVRRIEPRLCSFEPFPGRCCSIFALLLRSLNHMINLTLR